MSMNPNTNDAWKDWSNKNLKIENFQVSIVQTSIKHRSSQAKPTFDPIDEPYDAHDDKNQSCIPNTCHNFEVSWVFFFDSELLFWWCN